MEPFNHHQSPPNGAGISSVVIFKIMLAGRADNQSVIEVRTRTFQLFQVLSVSIICLRICPNPFTAGHHGASVGRLNSVLVAKSAGFAEVTTVLSLISTIIYNSSATRQNHGGMTCMMMGVTA
jgi:hypothetical protein